MKIFTQKTHRISLILIGLSLFLPYLGAVHLFDWDEINFAEAAREMLVTQDFSRLTINYEPFWEKPPLFIWLQALSMSVFGVNEFAARFPNVIAGIVSLLFLYRLGTKIKDQDFGLLWVIMYACSLLPAFYFRSGIIDPWFNFFTFAGVSYFVLYQFKISGTREVNVEKDASYYLIISGIFIGLAMLTKGPVALLVFGAFGLIFFIFNKFKYFFTPLHLLYITLSIFITASLWFGYETIKNGTWFLEEFIVYQIRLFKTEDAGHGGPFYYHFIVLLFGCFPASIFMIDEFFRKEIKDSKKQLFKNAMIILFLFVLALFSIVNTKIIHYSSLCYFPLTYLGALNLHRVIKNKLQFSSVHKIGTIAVGTILALSFVLLPTIGIYIEDIKEFINDEFTVANLQARVYWRWYHFMPGIFFFAALIYALFLYTAQKGQRATLILFFGTLFSFLLNLSISLSQIEGYTQRTAIEFYKKFKGKDVYVSVVGFKSYAHLFYTQKMPQANPLHIDNNWLLTGDIDKTAYFVSKNNHEKNMAEFEKYGLKVLARKNGFVFYKREKPKSVSL
jgi:4-amino-4-deoxy-L-arabinose transferase-like glycosyltransferase